MGKRKHQPRRICITFYLVMHLFVLLFITSCASIGRGGSSFSTFDPYKGTTGAVINFEKNAPPEKVVEGELVSVIVRMNNEGAIDITGGILSLNLEKGIFSHGNTIPLE